MANRRLEGWLFDVDELGPQVALWVYTSDGHLVRLTDEFKPLVYVQGDRERLKRLAWELERFGIISSVSWMERQEFWSGQTHSLIDILGAFKWHRLSRIYRFTSFGEPSLSRSPGLKWRTSLFIPLVHKLDGSAQAADGAKISTQSFVTPHRG